MEGASPKRIIIIGAATALLEVYDLIFAINKIKPQYSIIGALDDNSELHGTTIQGIPVLGGLNFARSLEDVYFVFAISSYRIRIKRIEIFEKLSISRDRFITLIHPLADISTTAKIGRGCTIYSGAVIGAKAEIGDFSVIYNLTFISPYAQIMEFAMVAALAFVGAHAKLGVGAFIAGKAAVAAHCCFGAGAMLAFGSVAYHSATAGTVMKGNPAIPTEKTIPIPESILKIFENTVTGDV